MEEITSDIILAICFLSLGSALTFGFLSIINTPTPTLSKVEYSECSNLSLFETSDCLNSELRTFYYYNISNKGKELTLEQLKTEGAVCEQYSDWYFEQGKSLGIYAKRVNFDIDNETAHAITIISNEEGYCIEDMINSQCWRFKLKNE